MQSLHCIKIRKSLQNCSKRAFQSRYGESTLNAREKNKFKDKRTLTRTNIALDRVLGRSSLEMIPVNE